MADEIDQLASPNEAQRLSALRRYEILDTPGEATFDRIAAMAARIFGVPMAVISLVDESRIWFKSHHGLNVQEIKRDPGLCASAILQHEAWVLSDAESDPRSKYNPLVTGDFGLRFYAGVPLRTPDGFNIGMLCALDREPHSVSEAQLQDLKDLAAIVMEQIELRLATKRAISSMARMATERDAAFNLASLIAKEYGESVQNSLELMIGLLRHQSRMVEGSSEAVQLTAMANRMTAITRAHQHISAGTEAADVIAFLKHLCQDLKDGLSAHIAEIVVEGVPLHAAPRPLIALGLIVNELVANAANRGARHISISLARQLEGYVLSVSDDGAPLPEAFDAAATGDFGLKIVLGQAQHISGKLVAGPADDGRGARFAIVFPPAGLD